MQKKAYRKWALKFSKKEKKEMARKMYLKNINTEIKIKSAFGGEWNFKPLDEGTIMWF